VSPCRCGSSGFQQVIVPNRQSERCSSSTAIEAKAAGQQPREERGADGCEVEAD
jgi:hypothetical protein